METHLHIYIFFTSLSMHGIEEEREATFGKKFVKMNTSPFSIGHYKPAK